MRRPWCSAVNGDDFSGDAGPQRVDGLFRQSQVTAVASRFKFENEIEQPFDVRLGVARQSDPEAHLRGFAAPSTRPDPASPLWSGTTPEQGKTL